MRDIWFRDHCKKVQRTNSAGIPLDLEFGCCRLLFLNELVVYPHWRMDWFGVWITKIPDDLFDISGLADVDFLRQLVIINNTAKVEFGWSSIDHVENFSQWFLNLSDIFKLLAQILDVVHVEGDNEIHFFVNETEIVHRKTIKFSASNLPLIFSYQTRVNCFRL